MRRTALALTTAAALVVALGAPVLAGLQVELEALPPQNQSEIDRLVQSFRDAKVDGNVVTAVDPNKPVLNPVGDFSGLSLDVTTDIQITSSVDIVLNFGYFETRDYNFDGSLDLNGPAVRLRDDGIDERQVSDGDLAIPLTDFDLSGAEVEELRRAIEAANGLIVGMPPGRFDGLWRVSGATVDGMMPGMDCRGRISEYGSIDQFRVGFQWDGPAKNDVFKLGTLATLVRCDPTQPPDPVSMYWQLSQLYNNGSIFEPMGTQAFGAVFPEGWLIFQPLSELLDSAGHNDFAFTTPVDGAYQAENLGFTMVQELGTFRPNIDIPILIDDPVLNFENTPIFSGHGMINFTDGDCVPDMFSGHFEAFVGQPDGMIAPFLLNQMNTGQKSYGTFELDANGNIIVQTEGVGEEYIESYSLTNGSGKYSYNDGGECQWTITMDEAFTLDLQGLIDSHFVAGVEPTIQADAGDDSDTTTLDGGEIMVDPDSTATGDDGGTNPLPVALVIGGGLLGAAGFALSRKKKKPKPCERERLEWERRESEARAREELLASAMEQQSQAEGRVATRATYLETLRKARRGASMESGGKWYHRLDGKLILTEGLDQLIESAERDLRTAETELTRAREYTEQRAREYQDARKEADDAKKAYDDCMKRIAEAKAAAAEAAAQEVITQTEAAAASVAAAAAQAAYEADPPCTPLNGKRVVRDESTPTEKIDVTVDFNVFVEVMEGSERNVATGQRLIVDLDFAAQALDTAGDLIGAASGGAHLAQGMTGLRTGKYVAGTGRMIQGGVETAMAADALPDIPTNPAEAVTEFLETITKMTSRITGAVTEWMENYQLFNVRSTNFLQTVTATLYKVEICTREGWVCEKKVWELEVSNLWKRKSSNTDFFDGAHKRDMNRRVRDLSRLALQKIQRDAAALKNFENSHGATSC